jgi:superfamily II DNA/RNA helicase
MTSTLDAAAPAVTFGDLGLPPAIVAVLAERNITTPLAIQSATIADALAGRDVSGRAPTGSGKTLAFVLPVAALVPRARPHRPHALILAPTRELAAQIESELRPLLAVRSRKVHSFYGGVGFGPQRNALRRGVDVAVACPGRLEDLMRMNQIDLSEVSMVVIDEADRMADMGFLPCVRRILDQTTHDRQTMLFSATLDGAVDVLVRQYQKDPVRHEVEAEDADLSRVSHSFEAVAHEDRTARCAELVNAQDSSIVFVKTKHGADRLAGHLDRAGIAAAAIHGGRSQAQRDRALAAFRAGRVRTLVATDVAARGVHVDDVSCVIHYDLPADAKDYVHRSGRTARAGASGSVVALVTPEQNGTAVTLRRALDLEIAGDAGHGRPGGSGSGSRQRSSQPRRSSSGRPSSGGSSYGRNSSSYSGRSERSESGQSQSGGARYGQSPASSRRRPEQPKGRRSFR